MFLMMRSHNTNWRPCFSRGGDATFLAIALAAALVVLAYGAYGSGSAFAATITVDRNDDPGVTACTGDPNDCSLRGAVTQANTLSGSDTIEFAATAIAPVLDSPLPPLTFLTSITRGGSLFPVIKGTPSYASSCGPSDFALTFNSPAANGSSLRGIPIYDVCGRAVSSPVSAPTVRIGPRRGDGTLPVTGTGPVSATWADIFTTESSAGDNEATVFKAAVPASGGSFSYLPSSEPVAGDLYTATATDSSGTSTFAARAAVPADIDSPLFVRAVGVSQSSVRLDFNEQIAQGSLAPADFALTVSNVPRPVTAATALGTSVFLDTAQPWLAGEAGFVSLAGSGAVTDLAGNEILGGPSAKVYAGPGDLDKPVIRSLRVSPSKICKSVRKRCKRTRTKMRISLSEKARITTTVTRAAMKPKKILSFRDKLEAGVSWVKIKNTMVGRRLPRGRMVVTVVAEDVARSTSDPAETIFEVR